MSNWEKTMKEWDDSVPDGIKYLSAEKQVLMRRVRELESENARLKDAQRWIPVGERLPEEDGQYLGCTNTGLVGTHWLIDGHFEVIYSCAQHWLKTPDTWTLESVSCNDVYVTHWMPLPSAPEAEIERFTVHSDIERQDDKSPNDTQTQTIVYGKESEE